MTAALEQDLLNRAIARMEWLQTDLLYKAPEILGEEGAQLQASLPWQLRILRRALENTAGDPVRPLALAIAGGLLGDPVAEGAFTIDRNTGDWSPLNNPRSLEHRQALIIADSVLPGIGVDELDRLQGEIMSHDDPDNPGRLQWVPEAGGSDLALRRFDSIPADALIETGGQHPTLTALQASAADVPELVARIRVLEAQVAALRAGGSVAP